MRTFQIALLALLPLLSVTDVAFASKRKPLAIVAITTQQEQIRDDVLAGRGRYKDMPQATRDELLQRQSELLRMLEGKVSADDLTETQRMQAFNTLEWIEAAINRTEDERMICRREKTVGSNMPKRVCKTAAQIRDEEEAARRAGDRGCPAGICIE